ncbi:hypothetical protein [Pelomonas sp. KK5]|uniref:hypothetical protein n=1 Tax=Pelomonas sp. KK5 TaxID=1855730 RepID=UPI00097C616A|nr:hypothetical protein [Pelomonas sp. KK5]
MRLLPSLLLALSVAGCAYPGHDARLLVGASTAADITSYYGAPRRIWDEPDGGHTYEYSSQPFGQSCYMVHLGPDGRLLGIEDTLSAAMRHQTVFAGMTTEQVSRRLGQERTRQFFALSGEEVWDWNVEPDPGSSYRLRYNVHFKNGIVVRTSQSMVFPTRFGMD